MKKTMAVLLALAMLFATSSLALLFPISAINEETRLPVKLTTTVLATVFEL